MTETREAVVAEALMPFARKADEFNADEPDDAIGYDGAGELFTVGDFRRARSALAALPSCEGWREAIKQEREECAKIADMRKAKADSAIAKSPVGSTRQAEATARFSEADTIAAAIRRRGE